MMCLELGPQRDANRQGPLEKCPSIAVVCEKIVADPCLNRLENGGLEQRAFRKNSCTKPQKPQQFQGFVFGGCHPHMVSTVFVAFSG